VKADSRAAATRGLDKARLRGLMCENTANKKAFAEYARDLAADLAQMARASNLPTLAYWLELSRAEAECILDAHVGNDEKRSLPRVLH
jgi:hypothetical protein